VFAGFFHSARRIFRDGQARRVLLAQAYFVTLLVAASLSFMGPGTEGVPVPFAVATRTGLRCLLAIALGCLLVGLQRNPWRNPGLVPLGATILVISLGWAALVSGDPLSLPLGPVMLMAFGGTLVLVPLRLAYRVVLRLHGLGRGSLLLDALLVLPSLVLLGLWLGWGDRAWLEKASHRFGILCLAAAFGTVFAWRWLLTPAVELLAECVLVPMCRVRTYGPGREHIPQRGPLLIVANHSSYLDPFWLCKVVPRHARPMMTSQFYDLPVIHWAMIHVVQAIRVPAAGFRRQAPELRQAAEVLRQGHCLLIFPEGQLRKKEEQIVRPFGQGVWRILHELPDTPVMAVWIEGGWGSWASYYRGPPLKNKPLDWRRPIAIALGEPHVLPPAVLADHRRTRAYLMRACLECRAYLELDVPAGALLGAADGESGADQEQPGDEPHEINS
jgi:1-acyl-sn-glycerol-3-phosphate acyltransferase